MQSLLQNIMSNNCLKDIQGYNFNEKLLGLNENFQHQSMKDKDVITKFCQPKEMEVVQSEDQEMAPAQEDDQKIDIEKNITMETELAVKPTTTQLSDQDKKYLEIAKKLIDVELMMRDEDENPDYSPDQIKAIAEKLLKGFKKEQPDNVSNVKEFKAYVSKNKSTY